MIEIVLLAEVVPTLTVPNDSVAGVIEMGKLPVPVSAIVCGESGALSLIASDPLIDPPTKGANVTFTVQLAPLASVDPQVLLETA